MAMEIRCNHCGAMLEGDARFCGFCGSSLGAPAMARLIANRYVLRERIGSGSLGSVYRAEQLNVHRNVAIKLLAQVPDRDPEVVDRFRREGELMCKLTSAHTVTTYEYGCEPDGALYIAMELSPGKSLADILDDVGSMHWTRALRVVVGLCDSLGEAHALGIVHRDIKPQNILVEDRPSNDTFVKLSDFGLAKIVPNDAQSAPIGQMIGSILYNAPEQLMRRPVDARTDIYALGALCFRMITGRHPLYKAQRFADLVAAHVRAVPPKASSLVSTVPAEIDEMLACCLAKHPDDRYPDATALGELAQGLLNVVARSGHFAADEATVLEPVKQGW